jgi:Rap1a immunity proteins
VILTRYFFLVSAMALSFSLCSSSVTAEEKNIESANALLPYCKYASVDRPRGGFDVGWGVGLCYAMIVGVGYVTGDMPEHLRSCRPDKVTNEQLVRVVISYVEARPERMHEDIRQLALEAFHRAWPC